MSERDYYEILGVERDAELGTIKTAYRRLAVRFHPDKNPGDAHAEETFKEAAEAYAVLSDPEQRRLYDRFGKSGLAAQGGFRGFDQEIFGDFGDVLGDLFGFGGLFGGGRGRRRRRAGRDLSYDLEIEFEEAVRGLETRIQVPRLEACAACDGKGAPADGVTGCTDCGGQGQVAYQQGFFTIARACPTCAGAGRRITKPCRECRGQGRVRRERSLRVRIPPGVDGGVRLRMAEEGEAGADGGPPGDLYVVLHVREHTVFQREGQDLVCTVPISFAQAALGATLKVPTLDGEQTLDVPSGTQSGTRIRLRGLGVPALGGGPRGDQHVVLQVRTPGRLAPEERKLLERLAELEGDETVERGLFERVKDIFH